MNFIHPILAIAGISAIAIPIAIHLLMRRKHKPVAWGAMKFLLEAYRQQRRRLQMEQMLLLVIRCLLVALVGLAIARPTLKSIGIQRDASLDVYLVIDNTLTSQTVDPDTGQSALERHIESANDVLRSLESNAGALHRVGLVLLGAPASPSVMPPSSNIADVRSRLARVEPVDSRADLDAALQLVRSSIDASPETDSMVVVLSEFRVGSFQTSGPTSYFRAGTDNSRHDTVVATRPGIGGRTNIAVESVEFVRTNPAVGVHDGANAMVRVQLKRFGPGVRDTGSAVVRASTRPASETLGKSISGLTIDWQPGESAASVLVPLERAEDNAETGIVYVDVSSAGDTLFADNQCALVVPKMSSLRVGLVTPRSLPGTSTGFDPNNPADWMRIALEPIEVANQSAAPIQVRTIEPGSLDSAFLQMFDAIIVPDPSTLTSTDWSSISIFANENQGVVVVMPPVTGGAQLWTDAFERTFGTGWTIARESGEIDQPLAGSLVTESIGQRLLGVLTPEFETLVQPVHVHQTVGIRASDSDIVLAFEDGTPLIAARRVLAQQSENTSRFEYTSRHGMAMLFACPVSFAWTDMPGRPMFVPLLHELLHQGVAMAAADQPLIAGQGVAIDRETREIESIDDAHRVELGQSGSAAVLRHAGVYTQRDVSGEPAGLLVVRPDTTASDTGVVPAELVSEAMTPFADEFLWLRTDDEPHLDEEVGVTASGLFASGSSGRAVWRLLLAFGLVFAVIEIVLARITSHAGRQRTSLGIAANPN